ncbi:Cobalt-zinc-cadmium resistance protein CzcA [Gemmata obscuriglobus]|uniref:Multidrug transporter AcrB n=1 Tax=Gemmata obscuriglobus TaxID=114 RepID=A0A2Z3GY14_9BACT|nr:efflux RND transporter permease subunit [Gemmata obscuriglobus]AWM39379.1 multidrug transporter AcrB [Gemmata obscuriglobus]QEG27549.1 Cobalt-zinc-cadmium resistance protein CzcA [Gemmata obscuriglobus]VTS04617.1 acriflavin resistance protein : Efflux system protein OS=Nitratireductor pacificus pht-3B GN=NA2_12493 PE=4 SV=1: ACR_tran [Gemmata obscuriglobus UQM 2246]
MSAFNLSRWAVQHPAVVLYLILAAGAAGLYAYLSMGRAEDPSFTIKTMVVTAAWPGATSDEVQRQVADKIEEKLQETPYLDYLRTYSLPGRAVVTVQLRNDTPPKAVPDIWYQVRKKVGDIRHTFPEGVVGPFLDDEYGDVYVAVYALTGADYTPAELKRLAEDARRRLLRVKDVSKVVLVGERPEKVFVEFSHKKLATLGVPPQQVFDSLRRQNAVAPAGSVETPTDRVYVRVEGPFAAVEKVQAVPVHAGGKVFRLGDIAEVRRGYEDPPTFTVRHNGKPAVEVAVAMRAGGNVLTLGRALDAELAGVGADLPAGAAVERVAFQPHVVEESVGEFTRSFVEALVIVLVVSFLSLGWRSGVVVALSVPLVLAGALVVMNAVGMALDRISLGALILALGLLVDDAIIAVEMMVVKMEEGHDRVAAATFAWSNTAFPMLTGTLVTVVGFLPVGFARSAAGEYAGGIFWVVGIALVASWLVAVVFTPYLGVRLLPDYAGRARHDPYHTRMYRLLRRAVTLCVRHPRLVVAVTAVLFVTAGYGMTFVPKQFFPQSSRAELLVEFRLPGGSSFTATEAEVVKMEQVLAGDPDIDHFTAYVGAGPPRFYMALNPDLPDPSFAKFVIQTKDPAARERLRTRLLERVAADDTFALPRVRVVRLEFGPPVGFPVQFRVVGPDPARVREIAHRVRDVMRQNPHARDAQLEWDEPSKVVRLRVDQDRARALGLTPQDVSATLQTLLTGAPVSQYREGIELIDVVARAVPEERLKLDALPDLTIITPAGSAVPLSQVATAAYEQEEPILWRRDRETVLTVRADVADGVQAPDVTAAILTQLRTLKDGLPPGYRIDTGGAVEESQKANEALFAVFPVMIAVMLTLLMVQVQSFKKLFLVFVISPLGLIGAVSALLLFHAPFGFNALLGVIALAGMDMRNSVILIDQIEHDVEHGMSLWDAVIESAVRRARPVVLTAATAILAMIPLTRSVFWGPLAVAIMGGLSVATFLTLGNLPALYVLLFRVKRPTGPLPPTPVEHTAPPAAARSGAAPDPG